MCKELKSIDAQLTKFVRQMTELQEDNDFKVIVDSEGDMSIESPLHVHAGRTRDLARMAGIIDRLFNTQCDKHQDIVNKCLVLKQETEEKGFEGLLIFKKVDSHILNNESVKKAYAKAVNDESQ